MRDIDYLRDYASLDGERLELLWQEIERLRTSVVKAVEMSTGLRDTIRLQDQELKRLRADLAKLQEDFAREKREHELTWQRMAKRTDELAAAKALLLETYKKACQGEIRFNDPARLGGGIYTFWDRIHAAVGDHNEPVQNEPAGE